MSRDKVRAGGNSTGEKVEDKANKVWSSIKTTILANVSSTELTKASDLANIDKRVVLLATQKVGGAYEVHAVVKDSNAVDAVFASQLSTVTKAAANVTAETQAADQAKVLDDAKKALINAMLG